ncbi:MAG: thioredoxin-like domain-containing protein [Candidatus Velthaea sp.]|jgi:thiol-disulfide isomerase/thioredoxin
MKFALFAAALAVLGIAPAAAAGGASDLAPVLGAHDWINGPVRAAQTGGKVVLVDVFTVGCINCRHVTPELKKLHASVPESRLEIIGVHAPETPYERNRANVISELTRQGIVWPVAVDNGFTIWNAYGTDAWPTQYLFDKHGRLRKTFVGEGYDAQIDAAVRALLAER